MNEVDFVLGVFVSSGAGYLLGKHYERKRAKLAFGDLSRAAMEATSRISNAVIGVIKKRLPDVPTSELIQELLNECAKAGIQAVAIDTENKQVVRPNVDQTK